MSCNEWKEYKLDEVYTITNGLSKKRDEFGFGYEFLAFTDVFNNYFIPNTLSNLVNSTEKEREKCSIKRGDVFLTRTSEKLDELGRSCVALKDYPNATFNGFTKRLRPIGNVEILPEYVGYYFRSPKFRNAVTSMSSMTTRASLNNDMISVLTITVPPLEEQEKIANILSSLDDKIELNNDINKTLEEMAQAIFKRWFVDFEFPNADGKPYKSSGGEMVDSELGMIPKGWEVKSLDELTDVGIGKTPPRKEYQWFSLNNEDVKWVSIKDMGNCGTYILETSEYLTNEAIEKFKVKKVPSNTVILSFKLTVGRVAISPCELVTNEAIAHFKIQNSENLTTEFLYSYLKQFNYDLLGSTSSIATAVNSKIIRKIPIIVPPSEIMSKFTSNVSSLFELIKENELEIINLREMRDSLLPKLMSGEIDLSK